MICLEDYLKYMLKKWKLILAIVAASTLLFTGAMYLLYEAVVEETSILQEYYGAQVELYQDIVENENSENLDKAFFDQHWANKKLYDHFKEELRIAPIGYMEHVSVKSAAVFGAAVGCILAVSVTFTMFTKKNGMDIEE